MAQAVKEKLALVGITKFPSRNDHPIRTDTVNPALTVQEIRVSYLYNYE